MIWFITSVCSRSWQRFHPDCNLHGASQHEKRFRRFVFLQKTSSFSLPVYIARTTHHRLHWYYVYCNHYNYTEVLLPLNNDRWHVLYLHSSRRSLRFFLSYFPKTSDNKIMMMVNTCVLLVLNYIVCNVWNHAYCLSWWFPFRAECPLG